MEDTPKKDKIKVIDSKPVIKMNPASVNDLSVKKNLKVLTSKDEPVAHSQKNTET
jgi:hypothetical protein